MFKLLAAGRLGALPTAALIFSSPKTAIFGANIGSNIRRARPRRTTKPVTLPLLAGGGRYVDLSHWLSLRRTSVKQRMSARACFTATATSSRPPPMDVCDARSCAYKAWTGSTTGIIQKSPSPLCKGEMGEFSTVNTGLCVHPLGPSVSSCHLPRLLELQRTVALNVDLDDIAGQELTP
jgi:hypothetical protein